MSLFILITAERISIADNAVLHRYATAIDNDLGGGVNNAPAGSLTATSVGYSYSLLGSAAVAATVPAQAGAILSF